MQTDPESKALLAMLAEQERVKQNRVPGVRSILVVLSSRGLAFDREALREKIAASYPGAAIYFTTPLNIPLGPAAPSRVDLLIDFTGQGERQSSFLLPRKFRAQARMAIGRNAGILRSYIYDRTYDEKKRPDLFTDNVLARERIVQREVLALAGVPLFQTTGTPDDLSQSIALATGRL